ncbi:MAG: LPS export ABC transporter ATP-binding protein [Rectinemataceae bacterium]|nr:LPS export ABC transporter ATP-binding protein [Spirochaetaceae bacterium]
MSSTTLEARHLRKLYGRTMAVADVSFSMKTGEVVGLLGPNGAGKTTVFYMIAGLLKPSGGSVYFNQVQIDRLPMYRRARLGISYLPQEASVFRRLTVEQNILAVLEMRNDLGTQERRNRAAAIMDELGILHLAKQPAYSLSGGERRRTEIARALALEPRFLMLDEPFTGIDPIAIREIKHIVATLADRGIGVLITDHNVRDTLAITTHAYIISKGLIIAQGDPQTIIDNPLARETYLGKDFEM